jgi:hypothetical protein
VTPEQKARQEIDRQLVACGWLVQDHMPQDPSDEPASVLLERIRDARAAETTRRAHKRRKSPA